MESYGRRKCGSGNNADFLVGNYGGTVCATVCKGRRILPRNLKIQSVPRSKHSVSVIKTSQLMLYREIIAVCSQIHTKHTNTLCGQKLELPDVKLAVYKDPVRTAQ